MKVMESKIAKVYTGMRALKERGWIKYERKVNRESWV
jgi:hypothetical protein